MEVLLEQLGAGIRDVQHSLVVNSDSLFVDCCFFSVLQLSVKNCFIRGSVVRYVQLPPDGVDVDILHDATRREARGG